MALIKGVALIWREKNEAYALIHNVALIWGVTHFLQMRCRFWEAPVPDFLLGTARKLVGGRGPYPFGWAFVRGSGHDS